MIMSVQPNQSYNPVNDTETFDRYFLRNRYDVDWVWGQDPIPYT